MDGTRRRPAAIGGATVLLAALSGCGESSGDEAAGRCDPAGLVWVYSQIIELDDDAYPEAVFRRHDGSEQRLTEDDAATAPSVSPDGERVVFERGSNGDPSSGGYSTFRLYVTDSDGSGERPLLDPAYEVPEPTDGGASGDQKPAWSPDGSQIAFIRHGHLADTEGQVMVVSPDGGRPRALPGDANISGASPAWSSDGTKVAWVTEPFDSPHSMLYWSTVDGTDSGSVPLSEEVYGTPAWVDGDQAVAVGYHTTDDFDLADTGLLRIDLASGESTTIDAPLANLWTLPTGELAGFESDAGSHTLVVLDDLADPNDREEVFTINRSPMLPEGSAYDDERGPATAVPDDPAGWAACS
jgi:dipeptidyl aminopeptidase/acylaminoacyl peptidase